MYNSTYKFVPHLHMAEISPEKQNVDVLFSNTSYLIDFYQREYKWSEAEVKTLLDDILGKFSLDYDANLDITDKNIEEKYGWYYLNTYITNRSDGNVYIVDGQQRLTTITLILIALLKIGQDFGDISSDLLDWVESKIHGIGSRGKVYRIGHTATDGTKSERALVMDSLLSDKELETEISITGSNMVANHKFIKKYLLQRLTDQHIYQSFVYYFLKRVVIVNLDVAQHGI